MPFGVRAASLRAMNARAVEDAALRLGELRTEERQDLGLAALSLGLAVASTQLRPSLAAPLLLGGVAVGAIGLRAFWRRWDLVERLAADRDAHAIPEILDFASREAAPERRQSCAALIRSTLRAPSPALEPRVRAASEELEQLASELDDEELALAPACAVACRRLVSDPAWSPLLNPGLPREDLRSRVRQIRSGFEPRRSAA